MINNITNKLNSLDAIINSSPCISTYRSKKRQILLNIPILKPLLIIILNGHKLVGNKTKYTCNVGEFIFFTNMQSVDMRNIPSNSNYLALLIEFEFSDFYNLPLKTEKIKYEGYTTGSINDSLGKCVLQFIDMIDWAPPEILEGRRIEIIKLLISMGYENLSYLPNHKETTQKVINLFRENNKITTAEICKKVCMSESTLYRKLRSEGENILKIKEKILMGKAIHLLQTTNLSIERVSEQVGYASSLRFSQRFKLYFGLTPRDLKNTK
ncbi:Helix-turn-helix domain-containing protein [Gilliamella bombicola]|uniref:Helix-turn-helix domain-containing protein n=1 Tax=Gilliamella bombicola TaxID=1798182 RepID=A0A1C3ZW69_9GAMM|nr:MULTISPECIES: helix-turn-helix transcriptional regulator [Gilliamella]MWP63017.1 AraC family transcriptional regulator [Gilliamella sp. Pas-s25]SCB86608.1 Helix-turn-helix domain-containing protein [Gilliamella bombicola]